MFTKREMAQYSSMAIKDDNLELEEFYTNKKHSDFFKKCSAACFENSAQVLRDLAVKLHGTVVFDDDWKIYASKMGKFDNMTLAKIEQSAKVHNELPLYVTMSKVLSHFNGTLANIIEALLSIPRYDALKYLRPNVQDLLEKMNTSDSGELVSNKSMPCIGNKYDDFSLQPSRNLAKDFTLVVKSEFLTNHPKCEVESLQRNICSKNSESKSLHSSNLREHNYKELPVQEVQFFPSAPLEEERLSVFIQHTEHDIDVAKELSTKMSKLGIVVRTSSDIEMLPMMDCAGALSTILQEVDFIVPVVSKQFFQQIHPHMFEKYIESSDALYNRTLYQLMNTQYQSNRCINFKVRAVLLPDINRKSLVSDVVLFYGLRLWEEFPKLVRILKESKVLMQQYTLS